MQALIQLLGQQQQGNVMGAMGGTLRTGMQHLGQGMEQQAQQQMGMVQGAPAARLKLAMERLNQQKAQQGQDAMMHPATAGFLRQALARFGVKAPEDVPAPVMQQALPTIEKGFAAQESANARRATTDATNDYRAQSRQDRMDARGEKRWTQYGEALDPTKARSGELGKMMGRIAQAGAARQIIGNNPNPNSNQLYELARAYDRLITGGVPTAAGTEHLIPKTALGSLADFEQWASNHPVGRNQEAFVQQMLHGIDREEEFARGQAKEWIGKKASRFSDLAKSDQPRFLAELENWDLTPDQFDPQTWVYKGKAKAPGGKRKVYDPATGTIKEVP